MRGSSLFVLLGIGAVLAAGTASGQGLRPCNGFETTTGGVQARLTTTTRTEGSRTAVELSLTLKDASSGQTVASPTAKTYVGETAEVKVGEGGGLTLIFRPKPKGTPTVVDVKFTSPTGEAKSLSMSCTL